MQLRPPTTRADISGLCWMKIERGPMNRLMQSSTFCTRVRELEMRDVPSWAFFNSSIICISEADWKAALSPSERSACFCKITATAFSNAWFLSGRFDSRAPAVCAGPGSGGAGLEVGPEGAGLVPLDDLLLRRMNRGTRDLLSALYFPEGIPSQ